MSMHKNFTDIINVLNFDETLLRLLYYPPADLVKSTPDPLDSSLANILDIDTDWKIRNNNIMFTPKIDDLVVDKPICRLLVYLGRRTPYTNNFLIAQQQLYIDVLCHHSFENGDLRSSRINDRLNELFVGEKITGIGKFDYVSGGQIGTVTREYVGFQNVYSFGSVKK